MRIDAVPNRTSRPTYLLCESYRIGKKVRKRTLGNRSALVDEQIVAIRAVFAGVAVRSVEGLFEMVGSRSHGVVQAVPVAMQRLGFEDLIASRASPERERICVMVAARVVEPHTKLATTRWWHTTTLSDEYGVEWADECDLYAAMDRLLERQGTVERKLAARHLREGTLALYNLSSSYFGGTHCPLAKIGHNRDGKKNKLQVNYGLLTNRTGCPVAVSIYEGNIRDAKTLMPQVSKLRELEGFWWITALKRSQIRLLVEGEALQFGLFDERRLLELTHEEYPGERRIAYGNPELAKRRAHKRLSFLEATQKEVEKVRASVAAGRLSGKAEIGVWTCPASVDG